jgi:hypothetical protein
MRSFPTFLAYKFHGFIVSRRRGKNTSNGISNSKLMLIYLHDKSKGKGKAIPLTAWTGPDDSRKLKLPDVKTINS